jgi:hypothetical protein
MTDSEMYAGLVTTLLDRFAEPIVKGLVNSAKSEWENLKLILILLFVSI